MQYLQKQAQHPSQNSVRNSVYIYIIMHMTPLTPHRVVLVWVIGLIN